MTTHQIYSLIFFYSIPFAHIVAFALYVKWQIVDEDDGPGWKLSDIKWHRFGAIVRGAVFADAVFIVTRPDVSPVHLPLLFVLMISAWDMLINLLRKRKIFDVGVEGWDQRIGKRKWLLYLAGLIASISILFI